MKYEEHTNNQIQLESMDHTTLHYTTLRSDAIEFKMSHNIT